MSELEIEKLTAAVRELSGRLDMLICTIARVTTSVKPISNKAPAAPAPAAPAPAAPAPAAPAPAPAPAPVVVTEKEVMNVCLAIVRADRGKKERIKTIIKKFGGDVVADVNPSRYPDLKKELEAML